MTPVLRSSSARFIFSKENDSPCSAFIASMACVIISMHKSLPDLLFIYLLCQVIGSHPSLEDSMNKGNGFYYLTTIG